MALIYSTTEARARFAELLRLVQSGESVTITCRGEPVAELRPAHPAKPEPEVSGSPEPQSEEEGLENLRQRGILVRNGPTGGQFDPKPVADRPGALQRFLAERGHPPETIEEILDELRGNGQLGEADFPGMPRTPGPHTIPGALQRFLDERG